MDLKELKSAIQSDNFRVTVHALQEKDLALIIKHLFILSGHMKKTLK